METKLILKNKGLNGLSFKINNEEKIISDIKTLKNIIHNINEYINYNENLRYIKHNFYDLPNRIDKILLDSYSEEFNEYSIGFIYHYIMNCSSDEAKNILYNEYIKIYNKSTLIFDSTSDFLYVYTKDINEAKQFLLFVNDKYIQPFLQKYEKPS